MFGLSLIVSLVRERLFLYRVHPAFSNLRLFFWYRFEMHDLYRVARDYVGNFGWLNAPVPRVIEFVWLGTTLLGVAAVLVSTGLRRRLVVGACFLFLPVLTASLDVLLIRPTGFGVQARFVLPITAFACVLAAAAGSRIAVNRTVTVVSVVAISGLGVLQIAGWYTNARVWAVSTTGPTWFAGHATWSPPWGWAVWLAMAVVGATLMAAGMIGSTLTPAS